MNRACIVVVLVHLLSLSATVTCLKCYRCGTFLKNRDGTDTLVICSKLDPSHLDECGTDEKYCLTRISRDHVATYCSPSCQNMTDLATGKRTMCCQEDACNNLNVTLSPSADGSHGEPKIADDTDAVGSLVASTLTALVGTLVSALMLHV